MRSCFCGLGRIVADSRISFLINIKVVSVKIVSLKCFTTLHSEFGALLEHRQRNRWEVQHIKWPTDQGRNVPEYPITYNHVCIQVRFSVFFVSSWIFSHLIVCQQLHRKRAFQVLHSMFYFMMHYLLGFFIQSSLLLILIEMIRPNFNTNLAPLYFFQCPIYLRMQASLLQDNLGYSLLILLLANPIFRRGWEMTGRMVCEVLCVLPSSLYLESYLSGR